MLVRRAGTNAKRALAQDERDFHPRPTKFHALLGRLLPAALRLAASAEPIARKLFGQLVPALVHWLTRSARTCGLRSASSAPSDNVKFVPVHSGHPPVHFVVISC